MRGSVFEPIDLASQVFDLRPGVDFGRLQVPPRVDKLRQGVDFRSDGLKVTSLEDVVGVLRHIEVLLGALLAHNQVLKRCLTDRHFFKFGCIRLYFWLLSTPLRLNIGLDLTLLCYLLAQHRQLAQL